MNSDLYDNVTNFRYYDLTNRHDYTGINHFVICYIDDTTNIISCKDKEKLHNYIQRYYYLINSYYSANKLLLNEDKTQLLITCKNNLRQTTEDIIIQAGEYTIKQSNNVKNFRLSFKPKP